MIPESKLNNRPNTGLTLRFEGLATQVALLHAFIGYRQTTSFVLVKDLLQFF
jgi:hypothetical protein